MPAFVPRLQATLVFTIIFVMTPGCERSEPDQRNQKESPKILGETNPNANPAVSATQPLNGETQQKQMPGQPWFTDETEAAGLDFIHVPNRTKDKLIPEIHGSGVLVADFDRNGAADVLLVNSGDTQKKGRPVNARNRLYLNDGKGKFSDVTDSWNLPSSAYGMGGITGDFDNDGWIDVYLTTYGGGDVLLRNTGKGFEDVTAQSGIKPDQKWSSSAMFFDADNDGWLDLMVVRYLDYTLENAVPSYFNGIQVYATPQVHDGVPDRLFRNNRNGTFTEIDNFNALKVANSEENPYKGLAVGSADLTGDGLPDIYVANDLRRNFLLVNKGNFQFEESGLVLGAAYGESGKAQAGMGVAFAHFDDKGIPVISIANFQGEPANMFVPRRGMFMEQSAIMAVARATRPRLKWGLLFFDSNNDGHEELMIANGHLYDNIELLYTGIDFPQQNTLLRFEKGKCVDISDSAGPAIKVAQVSRGLAISDFNGDGRQDFIVSNNEGPAQLGINQTIEPGNFINLWLEGSKSNRSAIGAKLRMRIGDKTMIREIYGGMSYLSATDLRVHFGLGQADSIDSLEVQWPSGEKQAFEDLKVNQFYHLREGDLPQPYVPGAGPILPVNE